MTAAVPVVVDTLGAGALGPEYRQTPYREPRLGSGVLCPGKVWNGEEEVECESPLTRRLRGGRDTQGRPIAEYVCETCSTVFVAVTVSIVPSVRFREVNVPDDEYESGHRTPVAVSAAIMRNERHAKASTKNRMMDATWTCPECGHVTAHRWRLDHERVHRIDLT